MEDANDTNGKFVYLGLKNQLIDCIDTNFFQTDEIQLILNVDEIKLFKSSANNVWPISCKIFWDPDLFQPFTTIYSGNSKPKSVEKYLSKLVFELKELCSSGIWINQKHFRVSVKCFVCDTPARAFIKCIKGHNSFKGCERCFVEGQKMDKTTVFLNVNCERRTNESFKDFEDPEHHTGASPLCILEKVNMIDNFVLDSMHLLYLGTTKKIIDCLMTNCYEKNMQ